MSSRALGERYGGIGTGSGIRTIPHGGGVSLLDLLSGNTPSKLSAQEHKQMMEAEALIEKHILEQKNADAAIVKDLAKNQYIIAQSSKFNVDPEDMVNSLFPQLKTLALNSLATKDAQAQSNFGIGKQLAQTSDQALRSEANVGQVSTIPGVAGLNAFSGSPPGNILTRGAISNPSLFAAKSIPQTDKSGNVTMLPYEQGVLNTMTPGSSSMIPPPMSIEERQRAEQMLNPMQQGGVMQNSSQQQGNLSIGGNQFLRFPNSSPPTLPQMNNNGIQYPSGLSIGGQNQMSTTPQGNNMGATNPADYLTKLMQVIFSRNNWVPNIGVPQ